MDTINLIYFTAGFILATICSIIYVMKLNKQIKKLNKQYEKKSIGMDDSSLRVKTLENKIKTLETALNKSLNKD
ncbi:hypothetical protein IJ670_00300 [bacterium]|nr:hypothetical protein [bacterium]